MKKSNIKKINALLTEDSPYVSIKRLFRRQLDFQKKLRSGVGRKMSENKRNQLYFETCLYTIEEIIEGLREINHKNWRKSEQTNDVDKLKNEMIDEFRFFMNRCILMGMDAEEFIERLRKSYDKTEKRIKNNY